MNNTSSRPLEGRIAVITGASSGIGEATGKLLATRGATVALLARRKDRLDAIVAEIEKAGGRAAAWTVDVADAKAVDAAAAAIKERFGRVDIVVNNAGIMLPNPIEELRTDQWKHQIDLNIGGVMNVIGAFVPSLVDAAKGEKATDLVNISSIVARNIFPSFAVYSATKAYVTHLSVTLRAELGAKGVRVSAIEPGIVGTELQGHVDNAGVQGWLAGAKQQMDFLEPEDVAEAIAFTVSAPKRMNVQTLTIMPTGQAS